MASLRESCGFGSARGGVLIALMALVFIAASLPCLGQDQKPTRLPFRVVKVWLDASAEEQMLALVNQVREAHHLPLLELDTNLRSAARDHSRDMFARGYFDHISPDGTTHDQRVSKAGVEWYDCGENIALTHTVLGAHKSLMASPGHRANLLNPNYHRIGIGVMDGGQYGLMFTQEFAD